MKLNYNLLNKIMTLVIVLLFSAIVIFQVYKIVTTDIPDYDNALLASTAKNLSLGHGYATSFYTIKKFDPQISTGPTIIMPTALFIWLFGNTYWAPSLAGSCIIIVLLFIILWLPSKLGLSTTDFRLYCMSVLLFIIFYISRGWEYLWASICGDVPSALLAAAATMLLFSAGGRSLWRSSFAGLLSGAAFLTKTITAFNIAALLILFPIWLFLINKDGISWKKALLNIAVFVIALTILPTSFDVYKKVSLTEEEYRSAQVEARVFLYSAGSGIKQIKESPSMTDYLKNNLDKRSNTLVTFSGGTFYFYVLIAIIFIAFAAARGKSSLHFVSYALLLSFAAHLVWWLCVSSEGWIRHLYPALIFLIIGLSIMISKIGKMTPRIVIISLCLLFILPKIESFQARFPAVWYNTERFAPLLGAVEFMKVNNQYKYMGAGQWASWELEYLLPGVNNFRKLTAKEENEINNLAIVRDVTYRLEVGRSIYMTTLAASCEKVLFDSPPITVSQVMDLSCYIKANACECQSERNCPGIKNPNCEWLVTPCNITDNEIWMNGVMKSGDAAFCVMNSFHARKELTAGRKITFVDGDLRTIMSVKEIGDSLLVVLNGTLLDGVKVGYPNKIRVLNKPDEL